MRLTGQPERINIHMLIAVTNELNFLSITGLASSAHRDAHVRAESTRDYCSARVHRSSQPVSLADEGSSGGRLMG